LVFVLAVLAVTAAGGATITVTNTSDSGTGSLRQAVAGASSGDTITFASRGEHTRLACLGQRPR
jgi:hypothetical protein